MNHSLMVHYAVACLEGLDIPQVPQELSRAQNVPIDDCMRILDQLESAGLVRKTERGSFERTCSIHQLTALEVLQALWSTPTVKDLRMLYTTINSQADQITRLAARTGFWPLG